MILQNWWYTTLLHSQAKFHPPLRGTVQCDVLVVGGGMAGIHAAHRLAKEGRKVVLLERNILGGSSTGKSAGFLTPDSELELNQLARRYGVEDAKKIWHIAAGGVDIIVRTIRDHAISCDLLSQDSLFVGIGASGKEAVLEEEKTRRAFGFPSIVYRDSRELSAVNTGIGYTAGVQYGDTYGINPLLYAQGMKQALTAMGVQIYESTEVMRVDDHTAHTHLGNITAENIIIAIDKMNSAMSPVASEAYHAQTFLSISEPLEDKDIQLLFPGKDVMCWDSTLVYSYYRFTGDKRILLGGGSALTTFSSMDVTTPRVIQRVINNFKKRFPALRHVAFIQYWPGRIDTTKDLIPIVDFDPTLPHVQYILGCVGLPWAAFCGDYAARRLLDPAMCHDYCDYLKLDRQYFVPHIAQRIGGKMLAFSVNNAYSKYLQVDRKNPGIPQQHMKGPYAMS